MPKARDYRRPTPGPPPGWYERQEASEQFECPYCKTGTPRRFATVAGIAAHLLRNHQGKPIPSKSQYVLTVAAK